LFKKHKDNLARKVEQEYMMRGFRMYHDGYLRS
jgi:hypothetical protein